MGLRNVVCAACGALALTGGAMAQETVKLEYKLKPGTELVYKTSGTIKENFSGDTWFEGAFSGLQRFVIADLDAATGVMLVGQFPATKITMKIHTPQRDQTREQTEDAVSACRLDRAGNPVVRKVKDEEKLQPQIRMVLTTLDLRQLDAVSLPAAAVAAGATWETATDSGLPAIPYPMHAQVVSTLTEIKTVDGHRCALIRSKVTPTGKKLEAGILSLDVTGNAEVETLFDVDGGFSRSEKCKIDFKLGVAGQSSANFSVEETCVLDSVNTLPPQEAARANSVIRTIDAAVAAAYDGEYAKATESLETLKKADLPEAWKTGINKIISAMNQFVQLAKGGAPTEMGTPPAEPAQELFAEAEKARQDQKWADAVAKYKELAEKYPDHALASSALVQAANISGTKLNDRKSADELQQRAVAIQEKRAACSDATELYRLAGTYADAGDAEKAVAAYRKVVAAEGKTLPAGMRLLAQFRIGGLLEKQGKSAEAAEAYKAMDAMPADDDYATKLKEQAKKRIEALTEKKDEK